jgi:hypothetical protein
MIGGVLRFEEWILNEESAKDSQSAQKSQKEMI